MLAALLEALEQSPPYPDCQGRGIVVCFGGHIMTANAYVCLRRVRQLCSLPIEVFHSGDEIPQEIISAWTEEFPDITFLDISRIDPALLPGRMTDASFRGWPIKPYAIYCSSFREVLLLDCDNFPLHDPTFLFCDPNYREKGTLIWPDLEWARFTKDSLFEELSLPVELNLATPEAESGQILMDKFRCWRALSAVCLLNSDEFRSEVYSRVLGDKDTFRISYHLTQTPFHLVEHSVAEVGTNYISRQVPGTKHSFHLPHPSGTFKRIGLMQFAPDGSPQFLHRTNKHWNPEMLIPVADTVKRQGGHPDPDPELAKMEKIGLGFLGDFQARYGGVFPFNFRRWRVARLTELGIALLNFYSFLRSFVR